MVPADTRLVEEVDLEVDESTLTGESLSVEKQVEATPGAPLAERRCMLFAGTTVVAGTAVALVTAVGADTQQRRAADLISGELSSDIGLQHQLGKLTSQALPVSIGGGALVGALGLLRRTPLQHAVSSAIAIAVAAVPEGMPLVATLAQAGESPRRLTKFGALVRVPRSVEALGCIEVVCFDKTGNAQREPIAGVAGPPRCWPFGILTEVLRCAAHAAPVTNGGPQLHATDVAIVEAAEAAGAAGTQRLRSHRSPAVPLRQVVLGFGDGNRADRQGRARSGVGRLRRRPPSMDSTVAEMAAGGLRVIAVAQRKLTAKQAQAIKENPDDIAEAPEGTYPTLAGFLASSDTPRPQSAGLLSTLRSQGVGIKLITGDYPITAKAIAEELACR